MKFTIDDWLSMLAESLDGSLLSKLKLELEFCGETKNGDLLLNVFTTVWCCPNVLSFGVWETGVFAVPISWAFKYGFFFSLPKIKQFIN